MSKQRQKKRRNKVIDNKRRKKKEAANQRLKQKLRENFPDRKFKKTKGEKSDKGDK